MEESLNKRIIREYQMIQQARPEQIFPLLCPVREYDWIPIWRCDLLYTSSGFAELGCVFKTDFGDRNGPEIWVVSHYEPVRKIAFVRTGFLRTTRYEVVLTEIADGTKIDWYQEITGITPEGNNLVAALTNEEFLAIMVTLNKMLAHYLETGKVLTI